MRAKNTQVLRSFLIKHKRILVGAFAILCVTALVLFLMSRVPYCECGYVKLWHGETVRSENSRHVFDWYSLTHVLHGVGLYALLWFFRRVIPNMGAWFLVALGLEGVWEILENTLLIINGYRAETLSLEYYGDSIINSMGDMIAFTVGYYAAYRLPWWATSLLVAGIELGLLFVIRDNLFLSIIMLIHPIDVIRVWQMGG